MNKQYTGHVLQPNDSNALPRYIVAVRTEAIPCQAPDRPGRFANRFRLGAAVAARYQRDKMTACGQFPFNNSAHFWDYLYSLTRQNYTTWLVGHNILHDLRRLDFTTQLTCGNMGLDSPRRVRKTQSSESESARSGGICCIQQPPTIIGFRVASTQGRVICVDLLNWFPENLADISRLANWQIRERPLPHESVLEWHEYSAQIANAILHTFAELMAWVKDNDLGMFRYTAAAQSMSAFRHRFMRTKVFIHDNLVCKKFERTAYYGGRTECYRIGGFTHDVWQYDVQSMYPSIMGKCVVPVKLLDYTHTEKYDVPAVDMDWQNSIAEVVVRTDEAIHPVRRRGYCVFPVGVFRTVLAGSELFRAYRRGHILSVASTARYETAILFADFVYELWHMRQRYKSDGNELYDAFAKKILNSLYGKWAQQSEEWERRPQIEAPAPWSTWANYCMGRPGKRTFRSFGWATEELVGRGEIASSFPAVSAFITAAARCKMDYLRHVAGQDNVLYQGSDAILVDAAGNERLLASGEIEPGAIGKLRLEYRADRGHVYGCNDYLIGDKQVIAGRAGKYVTIDDTECLQQKTYALAGLFSGNPQAETLEQSLSWRRQSEYAKGYVDATGRVSPLLLDEGNGPISADAVASSTIN